MSASFDDQVVVVTGGGGGIGRGICSEFATLGATVVVVDVDRRSGSETAEIVRGINGRRVFREADIADPESSVRLMVEVAHEFGSIDVLVNCAGVTARTSFVDITPEIWDQLSDVNLRGLFFTIQAVVPHMEIRGGGRIVNIGSIGGYGYRSDSNAAYGTTKGGVIVLTRLAAAQLGPLNINVNCVCPGVMMTDMFESYLGARSESERRSRDEILADVVAECALGRLTTPSDVAHAVAFLASTDARNITGQSINIDGGMV